MSAFPVVLDACVLYNAPVRDTLLRAAELGLYRVHWSKQILDETTNNLIESGRMNDQKARHFVAELAKAFPEAMVVVPDAQTASMRNSPKDRHVAACAACAHAQVIATFDLGDFQPETLSNWNIEAQHPDTLLCSLFDLSPDGLMGILIEQAEDLKNINLDQLVALLKKHVPQFSRKADQRLK